MTTTDPGYDYIHRRDASPLKDMSFLEYSASAQRKKRSRQGDHDGYFAFDEHHVLFEKDGQELRRAPVPFAGSFNSAGLGQYSEELLPTLLVPFLPPQTFGSVLRATGKTFRDTFDTRTTSPEGLWGILRDMQHKGIGLTNFDLPPDALPSTSRRTAAWAEKHFVEPWESGVGHLLDAALDAKKIEGWTEENLKNYWNLRIHRDPLIPFGPWPSEGVSGWEGILGEGGCEADSWLSDCTISTAADVRDFLGRELLRLQKGLFGRDPAALLRPGAATLFGLCGWALEHLVQFYDFEVVVLKHFGISADKDRPIPRGVQALLWRKKKTSGTAGKGATEKRVATRPSHPGVKLSSFGVAPSGPGTTWWETPESLRAWGEHGMRSKFEGPYVFWGDLECPATRALVRKATWSVVPIGSGEGWGVVPIGPASEARVLSEAFSLGKLDTCVFRSINSVEELGEFFAEKMLNPGTQYLALEEPNHATHCAVGYWLMRRMLRRYSFRSFYVENNSEEDSEEVQGWGILWEKRIGVGSTNVASEASKVIDRGGEGGGGDRCQKKGKRKTAPQEDHSDQHGRVWKKRRVP